MKNRTLVDCILAVVMVGNMNAKFEEKLNSKKYLVRERLANFLGRRKNITEAPGILVRLLNDKSSFVRSEALNSLMKIGSKKYFSKVLPLLDDKNYVVKIDAIECIARLGKKRALKHLLKHLKDKNGIVRMYVGTVIGEIGDKTCAGYLEKRLKIEHSSHAKVGLLDGLYRLGQKERLLGLIHLLKSRNYRVRCAVANTFASLINKRNQSLIKESLLNALKNEATVAARSSMEGALKNIN
ncbi:MAG: HEAT repeat domain-containing protein [Firmicutes bacterium]|nr:HEAT repeat domain-containing protein [Bacillota bacterium]